MPTLLLALLLTAGQPLQPAPGAVPSAPADPSAASPVHPPPAAADFLAPVLGDTAATVTVWNRPIAELRATLQGWSPRQRAIRAQERIAALPPEALNGEVRTHPGVLGGQSLLVISVGGQIAFALLKEDVPVDSGLSLEAYADRAAGTLRDALRARELERTPALLARAVLLALLATAIFAVALRLLVRARRALLALLGAGNRDRWQKVVLGVDVGPVLVGVGETVVKVGTVVLGVALTYAWLTSVLGRFEYTRPWADGLGVYLSNLVADLARGAIGAVPGLFAVVVIVLLARAVSQAADVLFERVEGGRLRAAWLEPETARATHRVTQAIIWVFALVVAYPYIPGSESGVFKGLSVLVGAMLTLGSSNLVNQIMSGLVLVYSRALRPGDYVKAGDVEGTVTHVGLLSTKVSNLGFEQITIPNAVVVGATITNYSRLSKDQGAVASVRVTIGYDAPWRRVHALLEAAARATSGVRRDVEPKVLQRALSDFYVDYQLLVTLEHADERLQVLSDLHGAVQDAFNAAGVQIMSPHFMDQPPDKVFVPRERWGDEAPGAAPARRSGE